MQICKYDKENHFMSTFNTETGFYARTGIIANGKDTNVDPFMTSYPELIDVGIMGHCIHGKSGLCIKSGVQCYQDGLHSDKPNMSVEDFRKIATESKGKSFQFALGGAGDPDQHEHFEEILKICKENNIVPNFTSSGLGFNEKIVKLCKEYCGAVAISWYRSDYTLNAIQMLLNAGIKTNIHYVVGKNSIDEAIAHLENDDFPPVNAVIFLLHKPVGLGKENNVLDTNDERIQTFFKLVDEKKHPFKIGFDSCTIPAIINYCHNISRDSIDTCEGARWSMYITSDMIALPCSFDNQEQKWGYDIKDSSIANAWKSPQFEDFRNSFRNSCPDCKDRQHCMGGCPIRKKIVLCDRNCKKN